MMKRLILFSALITFTATLAIAQQETESPDFETALELYESEQYEEALEIFKKIDEEKAILFAGKSYFALANYFTANDYLKEAASSSDRNIRQEAKYTLALSYFGMKSFAKSLDQLHELITDESRTGIQVDANRFKRQLQQYLTLEQRFRAIQQSEYQQVGIELVQSAKDRVDEETYRVLVNEIAKTERDSTYREQLRRELLDQEGMQQIISQYPTPPQGMVYNIGVILPTFDERASEFTIPRNLYFGITLAAEEFNSRNPNKKVRLHFKPSAEDADSTAAAFTELVWSNHVDAVIGPLFSDPAVRMAELAEEYQIPMLAPLANSDDINLGYNYTFQLNPTFEVHGRQMARHAVQELGLDTLAVITQTDALGTSSAHGFRHEAERLGAHISYYIEEDFASMGFDLSEFTKFFTTDQAEIDSLNYTPSQGIYAPFTGRPANTLINLLMTDLEVMNTDMVVLGSEEWESANLTGWVDRNVDIYYSQAFGATADTTEAQFVEEDFVVRFGLEPDQFAKIGFDVAGYLFRSLETAGNPRYLQQVLRQGRDYDGLGLRINFDGKRVNQHVFIRPLSQSAREKFGDGLN